VRYYIDCEFDGHNGPLLSIALVAEGGAGIHIRTNEQPRDPWVIENVAPHFRSHNAWRSAVLLTEEVGGRLRQFIGGDTKPVIVADSPVDIARFCQAISTADDGGYAPCMAAELSFEVHDVDCYPTTLPGAVQHNAWWDAMALRHKLASVGTHPEGQDGEAGLVRSMGDAVPKADAQTTPSENPS